MAAVCGCGDSSLQRRGFTAAFNYKTLHKDIVTTVTAKVHLQQAFIKGLQHCFYNYFLHTVCKQHIFILINWQTIHLLISIVKDARDFRANG